MSRIWTRRGVLGGIASGVASAALAGDPIAGSLRPLARPDRPAPVIPDPYSDLIEAARLGDGKIGFVVMDAKSGQVLDALNPDLALPPASVAKFVTALYALETLGAQYQFQTRVLATGPVENGRLDGDLILVGGGDPTLDTDDLGELARLVKEAGIIEVRGAYKVYTGALPYVIAIDHEQPDHVGYNPAICGLNLNFNRVHFEWKRNSKDYDITMQARALKYRPGVQAARMEIVDRRFPVFTYQARTDYDEWTVAKGALGKDGARWLPVRHPDIYAGEVFQTLMRSHGIVLRAPEFIDALPVAEPLAEVQSEPLTEILRDMLKHSTNITAEIVGMTATSHRAGRPVSLKASAAEMNRWLAERFGISDGGFVDHSGLGGAARVTPMTLARVLSDIGVEGPLHPILKQISAKILPGELHAKTGTLNFVSGLAGYYTTTEGRDLAFSILSADIPRRVSLEREERENPPGARSWSRRARHLQYQLIERWSQLHGS